MPFSKARLFSIVSLHMSQVAEVFIFISARSDCCAFAAETIITRTIMNVDVILFNVFIFLIFLLARSRLKFLFLFLIVCLILFPVLIRHKSLFRQQEHRSWMHRNCFQKDPVLLLQDFSVYSSACSHSPG